MAPTNYRKRSRGRSAFRTPPATMKRRKTTRSKRSMSWSPASWSPAMERAVEAAVTKVTGSPVAGSVASVASSYMLANLSSKRSASSMQARVNNSYLGGKVKANKRVKRTKFTKNGRYSTYALKNYGVSFSKEIRATTVDSLYECVALGHNSLPNKMTFQNVCRSLVKMMMSKLNVQIRDFSWTLVGTLGFTAGDLFRLNYYATAQAAGVTQTDIAIGANSTLEDYSSAWATRLRDITVSSGSTSSIRWDSFEFVPAAGSKFPRVNICIAGMKVIIKTKSALKIQNQSVGSVGNDESDDVDNVPLQGKLLKAKGNNQWHITNRALLEQVDLQNIMVGSYFTRSEGTSIVSNDFTNALVSATRISEPPKGHDIRNCVKEGKIRINPGAIQTSILYDYREIYFSQVINLLAYEQGLTLNLQTYNPKLGQCQVFWLEKVIGSNTNIKLRYETNIEQSVACIPKFTNLTGTIHEQEV